MTDRSKFKVHQGDQYSSWNLVKSLGKGSYGEVFLYSKKGSQVAVKTFSKFKDDSKEEFRNEIEGFKQAQSHSHIVNFICAFSTEVAYCIALEYCPEGDLENLYRYPYTEEHVRKVIMQCSKALEHMRQHNVVHRDLKPDNILVRSFTPLHVLLTDFNFASKVTAPYHTTVMSTQLGTKGYIAPEIDERIFRNFDEKYNFKVDVFALGIVAFDLVARGDRPDLTIPEQLWKKDLEGKAVIQYYEDMCNHGVPLTHKNWESVSSECQEVIGKMILPLYKRRCDYNYILNKSRWARLKFTSILPKLNN